MANVEKIFNKDFTEPPFSGKLLKEERGGTYRCGVCLSPLFSSRAKFDSGTGWPSFDEALPGAIELREDNSAGMRRTEVICRHCGSHLGHLFADGPTRTGKRFCLNSAGLDFKPEKT